ncbi:hypothetical protein OB919_20170 [Halobacteria archaeon AArc-curdl1]|uniref:CARDB domain-containing protein n=1 Tax=Natronosalvus hydrolyticus TaxID=2979988 RepID=A0AAP2ZBQ6_9EURY|nr:hypothetical protein [Halobacteria archaeon AArc-curdl1]
MYRQPLPTFAKIGVLGVAAIGVVAILTGTGTFGAWSEMVESGGSIIAGEWGEDDEPELEVVDLETNRSIEAGEELNVTVEIRNTGEPNTAKGDDDPPPGEGNATLTQEIILDVDGEDVDGGTVELEPGENATVDLSAMTGETDVGELEVTVRSEDDSASASVIIEEPAEGALEVTGLDVPPTVTVGEPFDVTVSLENTGAEDVTTDVVVAIEDETIDNETIEVEAGETTTHDLAYETTEDDVGNLTVTVGVGDDLATANVEVTDDESGYLEITALEVTESVLESDAVEGTVEVSNPGDEPVMDTLEIRLDGDLLVQVPIDLEANETETLAFDGEDVEAGTYTLTAAIGDEEATTPITVEEVAAAEFAVTDLAVDTDPPVSAGQELTVTATVENVDAHTDNQTVTLELGGEPVDTQTVSLEGGAATEVTFTETVDTETPTGTQNVAVRTADDGATTTLNVTPAADAAGVTIAVVNATHTVEADDSLTVSADVVNTGADPATQTIVLEVDGETVATETVSLDGAASTTVDLGTEFAGAGEYEITLRSDDDEAEWTVTVVEPAALSLSALETPETAVAGEKLTIAAVITNEGGEATSEAVELTVGTETVAAETVELEAGELTTIEFTHAIDEGADGELDLAITSADAEATATVELVDPERDGDEPSGSLEVDALETNTSVTTGAPLVVTVDLHNPAEDAVTQAIEFHLADTTVEESVTVEPSETATAMVELPTTDVAPGTHELTIDTGEAVTTTDVEVSSQPASVIVESIDVTESVEVGETLEVETELVNVGDRPATQHITLEVDGEPVDTQELALEADESTTLTLAYEPDETDLGERTVTVHTENDSDTIESTVLDPATIEITDLDAPADAEATETITVTAQLQNTGDVTAIQDVSLALEAGEPLDTATVEMGGGENTSVTLTAEPDEDAVGTQTVTVSTEDDEATVDVDIVAPPDPGSLEIEALETPETVDDGASIEGELTVSNPGDEPITDTLILTLEANADGEAGDGGAPTESITVDLEPGETTTIPFALPGIQDAPGEYDLVAESETNTTTATITVTQPPEPAAFAVELEPIETPIEAGETLTVTAEIENTGEESDSQEVSLFVDGEAVEEESIELDGGASTTVTFTRETSENESHDREIAVHTADDEDMATVTVEDPPEPAHVEITDIAGVDTHTAGYDLELEITVTNRGEKATAQPLELALGDRGAVDSTTVELDGGESTTVTLYTGTDETDVGEQEVMVHSGGETATTDVTIEAPAFFEIQDVEAPTEVEVGDTIEVTAQLQNTGDEAATQEISLDMAGQTISETVSLEGGESATVTLAFETSEADIGDQEGTITSKNDTATTTVTVLEPPFFDVQTVEAPNPVEAGDTLEVTAEIQNTGEVTDTQPVTFEVGGETVAETSLELTGGETTTVSVAYQTDEGDIGDTSVTVRSEDDETMASVRITEPPEPPYFEVQNVHLPESVTAGESFEVSATVVNTGEKVGETTVRVDLPGGQGPGDQTVSLEPGASETITWQVTASQTPGDMKVSAHTDDTSGQASVSVIEPADSDADDESDDTPADESDENADEDSGDDGANDGEESGAEDESDADDESDGTESGADTDDESSDTESSEVSEDEEPVDDGETADAKEEDDA